ncbi:methyltransferase type 11 [Aurantimonas aggregata]|uniref:Methyltransferase type 11 n=1 Tax=Aurantimonas aggregata TaxID=2047720 RepID=A0A6L9MMF9_9HYPH|nr:class I SAM-dependent methyltransferase [Aurantimonas aggregata]NDV89039.1 methyltransferase type 11 [Aurantimonas aggregata]
MAQISQATPARLEIGVGHKKRDPMAVGIDIIDTAAADIVGDALEVLRNLPSLSITSIQSFHVFEHLDDIPGVMHEVERILVTGGEMTVVVPHFSNPFYYSDPTHRNFFGLYTFSYYCHDQLFRRTVPTYSRQKGLSLVHVRLVFKSFPPRYIAFLIRKGFEVVFNACNWAKEIYEDSFSNVISCYEIKYVIRKVNGNENGSRS